MSCPPIPGGQSPCKAKLPTGISLPLPRPCPGHAQAGIHPSLFLSDTCNLTAPTQSFASRSPNSRSLALSPHLLPHIYVAPQ